MVEDKEVKLDDKQIEKKIEQDLSNMNQKAKDSEAPTPKFDLKELKKIDSSKDSTKKDNKKLISKIYKYWVHIIKDGESVTNFGVNEEDIAGVKMLVRRENIGGEDRIIFRELYPEPGFKLNHVKNNKNKYKAELNKLKQIEKKLEDNLYEKSPKIYNYEIADVRTKILEIEILLDSIEDGVHHTYIFKGLRPDGISTLLYRMDNSGLELIKYVEEKNIFRNASEAKRIDSEMARKQIDHQLKKSNERDWQKIAITFMSILLLAIATYATFQWLNYNEDKAFADTKAKLDLIILQQQDFVSSMIREVEKVHKQDATFEKQIIEGNQEILNQCYMPTKLPTGG